MNIRLKDLVLRTCSFAIAAVVICGCPPETKNAQVQVRNGYWVITLFEDDGRINNKTGLKLNADGTVAIYTQGDNPVDGLSWEQNGNSFAYKSENYTFNATVARDDYLEGLVFFNPDPTTPVLSFVMRFISADVFGLPRVSEGHWKFVLSDLLHGVNEYGIKLNANGTVEESPLGSPFFPLDEVIGVWSENHGEFKLEFYDKNNALLLRLITAIESSSFLEGRQGTQGEFAAQFDPTVVDANVPIEQAPIN